MTRFQVRKKLLKASTGATLTGFSLRSTLKKKLPMVCAGATFVALGTIGTMGAAKAVTQTAATLK